MAFYYLMENASAHATTTANSKKSFLSSFNATCHSFIYVYICMYIQPLKMEKKTESLMDKLLRDGIGNNNWKQFHNCLPSTELYTQCQSLFCLHLKCSHFIIFGLKTSKCTPNWTSLAKDKRNVDFKWIFERNLCMKRIDTSFFFSFVF